jgi:hypothetical protein
MTNKAELEGLEQDVARARRRLAEDLARLRSPDTLSGFKNDVLAQIEDSKNQLMGMARQAASDRTQGFIADLRARAAANPIGVLAIGAGLAWRLFRHPPVTTLLIGAGIASFLRPGRANHHGEPDMLGRANQLAGTVATKVQEWGEEARDATQHAASQVAGTASNFAAQAREWRQESREMAHRTVSQVADTASNLSAQAREWRQDVQSATEQTASHLSGAASSLAARARDWRDDARDATQHTVSQLSSTASNVAAQARGLTSRALAADQDVRDTYLLAGAALAIGAATVIAYQRKGQQP